MNNKEREIQAARIAYLESTINLGIILIIVFWGHHFIPSISLKTVGLVILGLIGIILIGIIIYSIFIKPLVKIIMSIPVWWNDKEFKKQDIMFFVCLVGFVWNYFLAGKIVEIIHSFF